MSPVLTYRALAALLEYPEAGLIAALPEIEAVLEQEAIVTRVDRTALAPLFAHLAQVDLYALQEQYVALFDRGRATSLNLFEHVHGESRDRGQAMVDLSALYRAHGVELVAPQLPDYLPALLEYLSLREAAEARALLEDMASILDAVGSALARRASPYAALFRPLLRLAGEPEAADRLTATAEPAIPEAEDTVALDREWAEAEVKFLGGDCGEAKPQTAVIQFHRERARAAI